MNPRIFSIAPRVLQDDERNLSKLCTSSVYPGVLSGTDRQCFAIPACVGGEESQKTYLASKQALALSVTLRRVLRVPKDYAFLVYSLFQFSLTFCFVLNYNPDTPFASQSNPSNPFHRKYINDTPTQTKRKLFNFCKFLPQL